MTPTTGSGARKTPYTQARPTQRYNRRNELLDDSPGYPLAASLADALDPAL
ncbi:hypothetical protein [Streptomyces inhibens]|uniref:hypothetical protein n=1 Tax=Streptomyces inhibens TaxID=2293571 RepID=UPI001EE6BF2F|nr:hypothetical protein [Streptomyces inhibens]UKY54821.1 hypothetical protein KI385_42630 [Streptomyces inhibens]